MTEKTQLQINKEAENLRDAIELLKVKREVITSDLRPAFVKADQLSGGNRSCKSLTNDTGWFLKRVDFAISTFENRVKALTAPPAVQKAEPGQAPASKPIAAPGPVQAPQKASVAPEPAKVGIKVGR